MGTCITVWGLIYNAYEVRSMWDRPAGLPAWADNDKFDVQAKANDDVTAALLKLPREEQETSTREMLQSLLADRFKLRVHYESKVQPVYELVVAPRGPKLEVSRPDAKSGGGRISNGEIALHGRSVAMLAHFMNQFTGRTVVDKTGLNGNYEIDLKWTPDDLQGTPDAGPTLFTAIQEQLGLKLIPSQGPVKELIVDHVEQPSEN
jgi:uncharacterized protein (TIGR03435 family)